MSKIEEIKRIIADIDENYHMSDWYALDDSVQELDYIFDEDRSLVDQYENIYLANNEIGAHITLIATTVNNILDVIENVTGDKYEDVLNPLIEKWKFHTIVSYAYYFNNPDISKGIAPYVDRFTEYKKQVKKQVNTLAKIWKTI